MAENWLLTAPGAPVTIGEVWSDVWLAPEVLEVPRSCARGLKGARGIYLGVAPPRMEGPSRGLLLAHVRLVEPPNAFWANQAAAEIYLSERALRWHPIVDAIAQLDEPRPW